jgi:integrase
MGTKRFAGGVTAASRGRIQFDFMFEGIRYRPSIQRPPSEANLRRARERLEEINRQIEAGTFSFAEEFPDYRLLRRLTGTAAVRTCNHVFDAFLAHCEARFSRGDMAAITLSSYRKVLDSVWRPTLGPSLFHRMKYSELVEIADGKLWSKNTYNNAISILRRAFNFGYCNHPEQYNPARSLRGARLRKTDRPRIDPFCMQDAETLIAAIHRDWGEAQGNYDEFRLFTGMRPSEEIALLLSDVDQTPFGPISSIRSQSACVSGSESSRNCVAKSKVRFLDQAEELRLRAALKARDEELQNLRTSGNARRQYRHEKSLPLLPHFGDHLTPAVLLSMNTGLRRGEVLKLRWTSVDFNRRLLIVEGRNAKNRQTRHVPLNEEAVSALRRWREQSGSRAHVFDVSTGFRGAWNKLLKRARISHFRWHDLRHHFASRLVQRGVPLNTVRDLLGHSSVAMSLRYAHLAPDQRCEAVAKLNEQPVVALTLRLQWEGLSPMWRYPIDLMVEREGVPS